MTSASAALSTSASDARQLATAFHGILVMSDNLVTWLNEITSSDDGSNSAHRPSGLTSGQVSQLLSRVSVFTTYSKSHADVAAAMAQRAEGRATEASRTSAPVVTPAPASEKKKEKKRSSIDDEATTNATASASSKKAKTTSKRGTSAAASTAAASGKKTKATATPTPSSKVPKSKTNMEKNVIKELKHLRSLFEDDDDKSRHFQFRSSLFRLHKILDKNGQKGLEALRENNGIDVVLKITEVIKKHQRSSNDIKGAREPMVEIVHLLEPSDIVTPDRLHILMKKENFAYNLENLEKLNFCMAADGPAFASALKEDSIAALLETIARPPTTTGEGYSMEEPWYNVKAHQHELVINFVRGIAEIPEGLAKLEECMPRDKLFGILANHEKEVKYKDYEGNWAIDGQNCSEDCHSSAKRVKMLLGGDSSDDPKESTEVSSTSQGQQSDEDTAQEDTEDALLRSLRESVMRGEPPRSIAQLIFSGLGGVGRVE